MPDDDHHEKQDDNLGFANSGSLFFFFYHRRRPQLSSPVLLNSCCELLFSWVLQSRCRELKEKIEQAQEISPSPGNPQPPKKRQKIFQKTQDQITISPGVFIVHTYFFASVFRKL
jgi:hypothetical protein